MTWRLPRRPGRAHADARSLARHGDRRHQPVFDVCAPGRHQGRGDRNGGAIDDANYAFPALRLTTGDVTLVHRGVVPAVSTRNNRARPEAVARHSRSRGRWHPRRPDRCRREVHHRPRRRREGNNGRLPVVSTGAWLRRGPRRRRCRAPASPTTRRWRSKPRATSHVDLPLPVIRHLIALYAEAAPRIIRLMQERPELPARWRPASPHSAPRCSTSSVTKWRSGSPTSSSGAPVWARQSKPADAAVAAVCTDCRRRAGLGRPIDRSGGGGGRPAVRRRRLTRGLGTAGLGTAGLGTTGSVKALEHPGHAGGETKSGSRRSRPTMTPASMRTVRSVKRPPTRKAPRLSVPTGGAPPRVLTRPLTSPTTSSPC